MARKKKESFIMYHDQGAAFFMLSDEAAGRLIKAVFAKAMGMQKPQLESAEDVAYGFISRQMDRDAAKYCEVSDRRKRSADIRWGNYPSEADANDSNVSFCNQTDTDASTCMQMHFKNADTDSVHVNGTENGTGTENENERSQSIMSMSCQVGSPNTGEEIFVQGILPDTMIRLDSTGQCGMVFEDVLRYGRENGYRDEVIAEFWKQNNSHGWTIYGKPIENWRAALDGWCRGTGSRTGDELPF